VVLVPVKSDAGPRPMMLLVANSNGFPLLSARVCPEAFVMVKYGSPFCTSIDEMIPETVLLELGELLDEDDVVVLTVAAMPTSEADCITAKLLWNAENELVSCS
jgi:hypothetical protein